MVSRISAALCISTVNKVNIHPALVLHLLILLLLVLTPFANLHHFLIALSQFRFSVTWLAVFFYANSLFLMGISIVIYSFLICAHFFRMQPGCKPRAGYKYTNEIQYSYLWAHMWSSNSSCPQ